MPIYWQRFFFFFYLTSLELVKLVDAFDFITNKMLTAI